MHTKQVREFLLALDALQKTYFSCYSERGGCDWEIAEARSALYSAVSKLRKVYQDKYFSAPECLYETIFLLGLLRFRVRDRALFEMCQTELSSLSTVISGLLCSVGSKNSIQALKEFDCVTDAFHTLYDTVLSVTAREPEVFEFLFAHLSAFRREILKWMEDAAFAVES